MKKEFLKAVESGDIRELNAMFADGADPNFKTSFGESPLILALHRQQHAAAVLLLDAGADPNAPANDGATPLFWAARYGALVVVEKLLQLGADVHAGRERVVPPLAVAVTNNHVEVVRALIAAGADADRPYLGKRLAELAKSSTMRSELARKRRIAPRRIEKG